MVHFRIHFSYPLLLLVFLFGAVMTALLYFRLSKKYRKTGIGLRRLFCI